MHCGHLRSRAATRGFRVVVDKILAPAFNQNWLQQGVLRCRGVSLSVFLKLLVELCLQFRGFRLKVSGPGAVCCVAA